MARRVEFEHDGHRFDAEEHTDVATAVIAEPQIRWVVNMDGAPALEFQGPFPYRDDEVRRRVVEWYEIQKPRR